MKIVSVDVSSSVGGSVIGWEITPMDRPFLSMPTPKMGTPLQDGREMFLEPKIHCR